jgi:hypothetical protein
VNLNLNNSSVIGNVAGGFWNGTMHEILYFNRALSTVERQQVEGYLAAKWTLTQLNLLTSPHPYQPLAPVGVLPTTIPGCILWLDAADASTLTLSGSNITQWADKSGNSNTAVAGTSTYPIYAQNGLNGAPIVRLQGANDYFLVANNFTTTTYPSITYFIVINPAASQPNGTYAGILSTDTPGAYGRTLGFGGGSWQQEYYSNFTNITPYTANVWTLVSLGFVGTSSATLHLNGVAYAATASGTGTNTTGFKIGTYNDAGGYATYNATFDCAEILVYGASLTTAQRQQIEGYLAWKWGTRTPSISVPATHPYATFPPTLRPFGPTDVSGCILWLDAADRKTLFQDSGGTQPITAVGQSIGLWRDKSTRGYSMTVPSGKSAPTYGNNVITTTGTNALWSTTNFELTGNAKLTLFFVFASSVASGYNTSCAAWIGNPNSAVAGKIIGLGIAVQGLPSEYVYFVPSTFSSAELSSSQSRLVGVPTLTMAKYDGTTVYGNYNGASLAPSGIVAAGGANWSALPFQTGMRSANAGGSADGFMCEVLCYNDALSTLQIQQIEGYLARKWGLNSSVAVGHPYRFGLPPLTAEVTPRAIPGCALWLDAADRPTLTLSGSSVTAWADKSGNGRNATQSVSGNRPTYSASQGTVSFTASSSSFLNLPDGTFPSGNGAYSILAVVTPVSGNHMFGSGTGAQNQALFGGWNLPTGLFDAWFNVDYGASYSQSITNQNTLIGFFYTQSLRYLMTNGVVIGSQASSNRNSSSLNNSIGGFLPQNLYSTFFLREFFVYSRALSTSEYQQLEGYLAWKWGLQGSLPGGHPFRMLKP